MSAALHDLNPYLVMVLVGFLPNEVWRLIGVAFARRIDEGSELLLWVRAVATAVLAGVIAQLIFYPPGALAGTHLAVRLAGAGVGLAVFLATRRSVFAGIVAGQLTLVVGTYLLG
jgi:hypothetical protein